MQVIDNKVQLIVYMRSKSPVIRTSECKVGPSINISKKSNQSLRPTKMYVETKNTPIKEEPSIIE